MVLEKIYIFGHLVDFFFYFCELGLQTFEVAFKLCYLLVAFLFLNFERDFSFVKHIIYQLCTHPDLKTYIFQSQTGPEEKSCIHARSCL